MLLVSEKHDKSDYKYTFVCTIDATPSAVENENLKVGGEVGFKNAFGVMIGCTVIENKNNSVLTLGTNEDIYRKQPKYQPPKRVSQSYKGKGKAGGTERTGDDPV